MGKGEFFETKLCLKELFLQHHCGTRKPFITTLCDFFLQRSSHCTLLFTRRIGKNSAQNSNDRSKMRNLNIDSIGWVIFDPRRGRETISCEEKVGQQREVLGSIRVQLEWPEEIEESLFSKIMLTLFP